MLHFAYGANMDRAVMRRQAPWATPIGAAALADHRFVVTADGYASVVPARARTAYGVLWRLTPRDRVTLDRWERVSAGEYGVRLMPVQRGGRRRPALVYVARPRPAGRPGGRRRATWNSCWRRRGRGVCRPTMLNHCAAGCRRSRRGPGRAA